ISTSYASNFGKVLEPVMKPIGMDWRIGVSLIATFTAREVFVSSLALILKATDSEENLQKSIINQMNQAKIESTGNKMFTTSTTIGLIVFFVFALQCISTIAIIKKETGGWKIPIIQVLTFTSLAY
ncbi:MAG: ferrous iron transporter B, partial [Ignavibacteriae bacterium]|nr:ferrous iron transporter B [Ignavibacteriota bacterium]